MAWTCNSLYLCYVKICNLFSVNMMLLTKFLYFFQVVLTNKLLHNFFRYIPTNIFSVITITKIFTLFIGKFFRYFLLFQLFPFVFL